MKLYFFLAILLASTLSTSAQQIRNLPTFPKNLYPGTVTALDGQTLKGYVVVGSRSGNQNECIFYTDYNDSRSRKVYHPNEALGYSIENHQYRSVSYSGNMNFLGVGKADKHFVYLAQDGAISTFIYWANNEQIFWKKGEDEAISNASMLLSFKKNMLKLVSDNVEIAGKVERKEKGYGMLNLTQIIDEYNSWALSKK